MRARIRSASLALAGGLLALACNPYDPNLGPRPFLCGTADPRCPDGYTAVDVTTLRCECQLEPPRPDAGLQYPCNGDPHEPNNTPGQATPSKLDLNATDSFPSIAVCPATDVDVFDLPIARSGTLVILTVTFDTGRRAPDVDVLDRGGVSLHPAVQAPSPGQLKVNYRADAAGKYFARLSGREPVNYSLTIELVPP